MMHSMLSQACSVRSLVHLNFPLPFHVSELLGGIAYHFHFSVFSCLEKCILAPWNHAEKPPRGNCVFFWVTGLAETRPQKSGFFFLAKDLPESGSLECVKISPLTHALFLWCFSPMGSVMFQPHVVRGFSFVLWFGVGFFCLLFFDVFTYYN